jgi:hypothetical protein
MKHSVLLVCLAILLTWVAVLFTAFLIRNPAAEAESPPALYVQWPETCAYGWAVKWEYNGLETVSVHGTKEEALRLYAVLAGRMVEREQER